MCRINPKVDIVFRKLFGSEENKDILKSFINSVLPENEQIKDLEIKNPYNFANYSEGRISILDIKAIDEDGTWYDIEIQIAKQHFFGKRILYYIGKVYTDQIESAEDYKQLNKVIGISLLDFDYFGDERFKRCCVFKDLETNEVYDQMIILKCIL